jgi:hypothetical protein
MNPPCRPTAAATLALFVRLPTVTGEAEALTRTGSAAVSAVVPSTSRVPASWLERETRHNVSLSAQKRARIARIPCDFLTFLPRPTSPVPLLFLAAGQGGRTTP